MSKIDELKADIERLPGEELAGLFRWLSEKEWERWTRRSKLTLRLEGLISWCVRPTSVGPSNVVLRLTAATRGTNG